MRRPLSAAAYLALVGAGGLASVQFWLHAFGVRESVKATEFAVPGAQQRAVPEFVLPTAGRPEGPLGRPSSLSANPLFGPEFLSGAAALPSPGATSPTGPTTPASPGQPSQPESPDVVAPQEQPAAAGDTTASGSPQAASIPTRALQTSGGTKSRSEGRKRPPRASRGGAVPASPARPHASVPRATPASPPPRASGGGHAPPKHDAKPGKGGKAPEPPPPSSSGAPGASSGQADHPGGDHGNGHGK